MHLRLRLAQVANAAADHRVLAEHELRLATQGDTNVGDLLGADKVGSDDESTRVLVEALLQVRKVGDLLRPRHHGSLLWRVCVERARDHGEQQTEGILTDSWRA